MLKVEREKEAGERGEEIVYNWAVLDQTSPILLRARKRNLRSYSFLFSLKSLAASTLAGESRLGSTNMEVTLMRTASMVRMGFHFYDSFYWGLSGSSTGGCRMEMQTSPFG
jgi:hypothetical protein